MKNDPNLEALVAAAMAEGLPGDDADAADASDPRLIQFQKLSRGLKRKSFDAPPEMIDLAKGLMPVPERRTVWAKLVGGTPALAGVRSGSADNFQLVFEAEDARARLMYVKGPKGWEVTGQAPGYFPIRKGRSLTPDSQGRFVFQAKKLGETGLILRKDELEILIPAADEAESNDPRRPD